MNLSKRGVLALGLLGLAAVGAAPKPTPAPSPAPSLRQAYEAPVARIVGTALLAGQDYETLAHLTDAIGPRLSGSPGAEAAVRWTTEEFRRYGLETRTEEVMVPHWERGEEWGRLTAPVSQHLAIAALGGSVGTPPEGLEAEVVEARGLEELAKLPADAVRGRFVLFNQPMPGGPVDEAYGTAVTQRSRGASEASKLGAVGALVRSVGTLSARLPHTGQTRYADGVTPVPAAAVAAEDADLIHRLLARGQPVKVRLRLGARQLPDVRSANVVGELRGRERPEEVVVLAAHLDSWDLATGAIDDGAGVAMVMESLRLLKQLGLTPRRTVRGVLYMNEENGVRGGHGYADAHQPDLAHHVAALEADSGAGPARGLEGRVGQGGAEIVRELLALLEPIGAGQFKEGGFGGVDIAPMGAFGVPLLGLDLDNSRYFDWHHSPGDTLDKVDPRSLAQSTAAMAAVAYVLADMPQTLPRPEPLPADRLPQRVPPVVSSPRP
jgi:hypothetical protein